MSGPAVAPEVIVAGRKAHSALGKLAGYIQMHTSVTFAYEIRACTLAASVCVATYASKRHCPHCPALAGCRQSFGGVRRRDGGLFVKFQQKEKKSEALNNVGQKADAFANEKAGGSTKKKQGDEYKPGKRPNANIRAIDPRPP